MSGAFQTAVGDEAARLRIRDSLGESLIVEASAGTGKTSELIRRIVNVLKAGHDVGRMVAVTFTNKAAGELKLRLRQELDRARATAANDVERGHLEAALGRLEEASIGTIHSFCGQVLRERPVEAGVDPGFEEVAQGESDRLFKRAFREWVQTRLDRDSPGLQRALARMAWRDSFDGSTPMDQLQYAARKLIEWRDYPTSWQRLPFDREVVIDALVDHLLIVAPKVNARFRAIQDLATRITRAEELADRDYDDVESQFLKLLRDLEKDKRKGEEEFVRALKDFKRVADADLAWHLREELMEVQHRYEELKMLSGQLDFSDLLLKARELIRTNRKVRGDLQKRFSHLFVDEFQDTDPLQAEIFLLLAADDPDEDDWMQARPVDGKLFVVGDPKQSIYKFRRADVDLYRAIKANLIEKGVGLARLTTSFRSVRPIQEFVNAAFAGEMTGDAVSAQAEYAALGEFAPAPEGRPSIVALPVPDPYAGPYLSRRQIDKTLPEALAAYVDWLINGSGWQVRDTEDPSRLTPIESRHVCLLFRRFTKFNEDVSRAYIHAFEARKIPHLLVGSKSFHAREEVATLRAALTAVEWPDDELSVFATLRGGLYSIADAELFDFRRQYGRWFPFGKFTDAGARFAPIVEALGLLAKLHRLRNKRPVAATLNHLLEATRAHAGFALRIAGDQVLANVYRLADLARQYELEGGISFRGFVELLEEEARKAESPEAPVLEEGAEGVRLMTVHTAKGLEFPVVLLADITARLHREPERYVDNQRRLCAQTLLRCTPFELVQNLTTETAKERAEGVRVAYVAATRAKDLLVVPAVGLQAVDDSWVSPLHKALYPDPKAFRKGTTAEGCPEFGESSMKAVPQEFGMDDPTVKPGAHRPQAGTHEVVWWDPNLLKLGLETQVGLRQEEVLAEGSDASLRAFRSWEEARASTLAGAKVRSTEIANPTDTLEEPIGYSVPIELVRLPRPADRPKGPRFGTLVHNVLETVDFSAGDVELAQAVQLHGRLLGVLSEEMNAAVDAVRAALDHGLIRAAATATRVHREFPLTLRERHGFVEGKVDLAFSDGAAWTLVDFKTDEEIEPALRSYRAQLLWYAYGLERITGLPVRAYLLNV